MSRVCLVSAELPNHAAGDGTALATFELALFLRKEGHEVELLHFPEADIASDEGERLRDVFSREGLTLRWPDWRDVVQGPLDEAKRAYVVYRELSAQRRYDMIHFQTRRGLGFSCISAKRQGHAFQDTRLVVHVRQPTRWLTDVTGSLFHDESELKADFMERFSMAHADDVVCSTQSMLEWVRDRCATLESRVHRIPNLFGVLHDRAAPFRGNAPSYDVTEELVLGPHDDLASFAVFCDALQQLHDVLADRGTVVTFLGPMGTVAEQPSGLYLIDRARSWRFPVSLQTNVPPLDYLASRDGTLVVVSTPGDAGAYDVLTAVELQVPVLVGRGTGAKELLSAASRDEASCDMTVEELSGRLRVHLDKLPSPSVGANDVEGPERAWRTFVDAGPPAHTPVSMASRRPKVVLGITHYERPAKLMDALTSALAQTYAELEVVVVDDGSNSESAEQALDHVEGELRRHGGRLIVQSNRYLGAARNAVIRASDSDYLCFLDDDDVAFPAMVSTLVGCAETSGADVINCLSIFMRVEHRSRAIARPERFDQVVEYIPIGGPPSAASLQNCLGAATSLLRRSTLERVGGYSEHHGVGYEDFELYMRILRAGGEILVCPEPLYLYEQGERSMSTVTSVMRNYRRIFDVVSAVDDDASRDLLNLMMGRRAVATARDRRHWYHARQPTAELRLKLLEGGLSCNEQLQAIEQLARDVGVKLRRDSDVSARIVGVPKRELMGHRVESLLAPHDADVAGIESALHAGRIAEAISTISLVVREREEVPRKILVLLRRAMTFGTDAKDTSEIRQLVEAISVADFGAVSEAERAASILPATLALGMDELSGELLAKLIEDESAQYLRNHPDVAAAVAAGGFPDALAHYRQYGHGEGRAGFEWLAVAASELGVQLGRDLLPWEVGSLLRQ